VISGSFRYDLDVLNQRPGISGGGVYESIRNAITFRVGPHQFFGAGDVSVTVGAFEHAEHFQIVATDLLLPMGWQTDHTQRSDTYGIVLQNVPPKGVIGCPVIPHRLSLTDFTSARELRLDFVHGVRFPGGRVTERATVFAAVNSLEEVRVPVQF
jgi:hypothetical protein